MKARADVVELLRAGLPDNAIARRLHMDSRTVAKHRAALGLPKHKRGPRPAASPEDLFRRRTTPTGDGHLLWKGHVTNSGVPALRHGGRVHSAYRIAFRLHHGRDPVGRVTRTCDTPGCVAGGHLADRFTAAASPEDLFRCRTTPTGDGHLLWKGHVTSSGTPVLRHGGRVHSAYRIAFRLHHGRDPVGRVTRTCDTPGCVAGGHLADHRMRVANQRADAAYKRIFGSGP
ncbi:hypothetical protein ACFOOM_12420 [Streptomyces echinoruber]|uniref:Uncharacterized protein n=1 Tax=Streptomyces echinoruber TaxID=68898 RepID=A0A918RJ86_9ACTN|nr:hypothetical protein [Streptomyces echinoruber]GHA01071.1 hypothetical protein GCM10010389_45500 [Streptomyces echinoruber]